MNLKAQSGNVLFFILIAVILFAALSYAVTNSNRTTGGGLSSEDHSIRAAQVLQFASSVDTAFQRLKMNGCGIDEISFQSAQATAAGLTYTNARAPSSKRCHLFDPAGGGVPYQSFEGDFLVKSQTGNTGDNALWAQRGHFRFVGTADSPTLSGVPNGDPAQVADTLMVLPLINDGICSKIGSKTTSSAPKMATQSIWTGHLLGPFQHRTPPQFMDLIATTPEHREGCLTNGNISNPNAQTRTSYWRILAIN